MTDTDLLRIYLRDHHAAAIAGNELAKRSAQSNRGTPFEVLCEQIRTEVAEDLSTLEDVMRRLDISPAKGKDGALWMAEKLGRLKLNGSLRAYSPLSRVIEFEGLSLNAHATRRVWSALKQISHRPVEGNLEELEARADDQIRRIDEAHKEAVRLAFAGKPAAT